MKKVCTTIICRLIKLKRLSSAFQLKYLGKMICTADNIMSSAPAILRFNSIFGKNKSSDKWRCFNLAGDFKRGFPENVLPAF